MNENQCPRCGSADLISPHQAEQAQIELLEGLVEKFRDIKLSHSNLRAKRWQGANDCINVVKDKIEEIKNE